MLVNIDSPVDLSEPLIANFGKLIPRARNIARTAHLDVVVDR
jgi:hypothetical protein